MELKNRRLYPTYAQVNIKGIVSGIDSFPLLLHYFNIEDIASSIETNTYLKFIRDKRMNLFL